MASPFKLCLVLVLASLSGSAQSFFKRVSPPTGSYSVMADSTVFQTVKNELRPEVNLLSYALPENALLTGIGVSYQHLKYDKGKWKSEWSINALVWTKTPLDGGKARAAIGVAFGLFNNLLLIGMAHDFKVLFPTVGVGINLNN